MRNRFSVFNFFLLLLLMTIVFRLQLLVKTGLLLVSYLVFLATDFTTAVNQFSFGLADCFASLLFLVVIPVLFYAKRKKLRQLKSFSFSSYAAAAILYTFLFAPVITNNNYDFQRDLSVTRLLPPLSSVNVLHLKLKANEIGQLDKFLLLKKEVVKNSFDEGVIFVDSFMVTETGVSCFQNGLINHLPLSAFEILKGKPKTSTKLFFLGSDELGRDIF